MSVFLWLAIIVWCLTTCFIFFQQTLLYTWLFPYLFRTVPQGYLRGCLLGDSSQLGPQIKHNSQLSGCVDFFFSRCSRKAEDRAFQENPNSTYLWGLATCSLWSTSSWVPCPETGGTGLCGHGLTMQGVASQTSASSGGTLWFSHLHISEEWAGAGGLQFQWGKKGHEVCCLVAQLCLTLRRNGVALIVNKRVRKAVLGYNLRNNRVISVHS